MKTKLTFLLITLVLTCAPKSHAATRTWDGSASGLWTTAANWDINTVPVNGDLLVFPAGPTRLTTTNTAGGATNFDAVILTGSNYVLHSPSLSITNGLINAPGPVEANTIRAAITTRANQTWSLAAKTVLNLESNLTLSTFTLTVDATGVMVVDGNVTGSAGSKLLKDGASYISLNGPGNNVPDLRVQDGTLVVDGVLAGGLSISNGAILTGSGTVPPFTNAGTVTPGFSSIGILTVSAGTARFNSGSIFQAKLDGSATPGTDYDQLKVSSPPNLSGASLIVQPGYSPVVGETFIIITNTGASAFTTTFTNLPEGATITTNGVSFRVSYVGGSGNDVVLLRTNAPPSAISSIASLTNGFTQLQGSGLAGLTYSMEAASNLNPVIVWTPLGAAVANGSGVFSFTDTNAPLFQMRFYRAVSP